MQTLERTRPMQIAFDFPQELEIKIKQLPLNVREDMQRSLKAEVERFLLQYERLNTSQDEPSITSIEEEAEDFTPSQLASIDQGLADLEAGRTISEKDMDRKFIQYKARLQAAIDRRNGK